MPKLIVRERGYRETVPHQEEDDEQKAREVEERGLRKEWVSRDALLRVCPLLVRTFKRTIAIKSLGVCRAKRVQVLWAGVVGSRRGGWR